MFYIRINSNGQDYYWLQDIQNWVLKVDAATAFKSVEDAKAERRHAVYRYSGNIEIVERF